MKTASKFWGALFCLCALSCLIAPIFAPLLGDAFSSQAMAYAPAGPLGLGYDYIGRPIAPQVFLGGRSLLLTALATAIVSRLVGLGLGIYLARGARRHWLLRFVLDAILLVPAIVVSLATYNAFNNSIYALIPIGVILSTPFSVRYYESNARPLFQSAFYEYARLRARSEWQTISQEIIPVLAKNILTDLSSSFISAIYMLASVTFVSSQLSSDSFLWSKMVSENLPGLQLNPWAVLAPLIAILSLTIPLSFFIDSLERRAS